MSIKNKQNKLVVKIKALVIYYEDTLLIFNELMIISFFQLPSFFRMNNEFFSDDYNWDIWEMVDLI